MQSITTLAATSRLDGTFSLTVDTEELPADILITVQVQEENLPAVQTAKWVTAIATTCDAGTILVPSAQRNELIVLGGTAETEDGTLVLEELGPEVSRVFARTYDPAADPEAFPGDFTEGGRVPLNSSVFLWIEALDANGNPVNDLSQAAKIKARVPRGQWMDLEDINSGTDRIEVPIYLFDEAVNQWQQQGVGWLEDGAGTALPESAEPLVIGGTFEGDIYAVFYTPHFSWLNVDYPYIGPWTLSRLNPNQRNTDCLYDAMQLARHVVKSAVGRASLMKFNTTDGDLEVELADGAGPELNSGNLAGYGQFKGNESGDRDDQFYLNNSLLDAAMGYLTTDEKNNLTVLLAVSILHETCHWKWDVKHEGGNWVNPEPGGEAGNELERDLFGGIVQGTVGGLTLDGVAVPAPVRDRWLDYATWPQSGTPLLAQPQAAAVPSPLNIDISTPRSSYQLGEDIELLVTYQNQSSAPIEVLSLNSLEGYPVWVEIRREGDTARVPFRGVRGKRAVNFQTDFASLEPGEAIQQTLSLVRDGSGNTRYSITRSGTYHITLFYSGHWGLPQTESETITIDIGGSGGLRGQVLDALTVNPIQGATVMVYSGLNLLLSSTTDASGYYLFPELAPGSYTIRIQADGYLRAQIDDVEVASGETTVRNINLSPFIAEGQMRLVLTWGAAPSDLDSHLEFDGEDGSSFHVAYYDQGNILDFPWAALDVDDTSSFGPETITISQLLPGTYTYSIHHYCCGGSLATSGAQVQVFDRSGLIGTFDVPTSTSGVWWPVLRIDGATGAITPLNPFQ